ncbi:Protein CBG18484 [Caenorhabditis briggsae]|uniref:Protein CBG18484 n=1 Tax=Caenorhabditis briggsae TaxID=6238 RepID=A8XTE9_CAEBR|nr:Protein CBG18484 [Caenorhabditis briggsae]CAP35926.1 Protein CBG18484 [Caenorhabditis briggsae]
MAPRKNKPIVQVQGYAMRFKKMNQNGTELFYCVERERGARCDAAYHFDRMNNTFTVKKQNVRHDVDFVRSEAFLVRQELKKCANDGKPREVVDEVRAKFSPVASVACGQSKQNTHQRIEGRETHQDANKSVNPAKYAFDWSQFIRRHLGRPFCLKVMKSFFF